MKLHWGTGIAIFYCCFVAAMVFMVIKSSQNSIHLVQENYYQKDLDYEQFRSKRQNATKLSVPISIEYLSANHAIQITFPKNMKTAKGKLTFFRPSNKYYDKTVELELNENAEMSIPVDRSLPKGKWRVQIDWKNQGIAFYKEQTIVI